MYQIGIFSRRWVKLLVLLAILFVSPVILYAQVSLGLPGTCRISPPAIAPGAGFGKSTDFEFFNHSSSLLTLHHVEKSGTLNFPTFVKPGVTTYEHTMGGGDFSYILVTPSGKCIGRLFDIGPGTSKTFMVRQFTQEQGQYAKQVVEQDQLGACPTVTADSLRQAAPPSEQPDLSIVNKTGTALTFEAYGADGQLVDSGTLGNGVNSLMPSHLTDRGLRVLVAAPNGECIGGILALVDETKTEIRLTAKLATTGAGSGATVCVTTPAHASCPGSAYCKSNPKDANCIFNRNYEPPQPKPAPAPSAYCVANPGFWLCQQNSQYPGPSPKKDPPPSAYCVANASVWICKAMPQYSGPPNSTPSATGCNSATPPAHCRTALVSVFRLRDERCPFLATLKLPNASKHGFLRKARFMNNTRGRLTVQKIHEEGRLEDWKPVEPGETVTFTNLDREPQQFMVADTLLRCMGGVQNLQNVGTTHFTIIDLLR